MFFFVFTLFQTGSSLDGKFTSNLLENKDVGLNPSLNFWGLFGFTRS